MADRVTRILLEVMAVDRMTRVMNDMLKSAQAWGDKMNAVSEEVTASSARLEGVEIRLQGASDAYAAAVEGQAAALGRLEAAQLAVVDAQAKADSAYMASVVSAAAARAAQEEDAVAAQAFADKMKVAAAETAAAVQASKDAQVKAYDELMAADRLLEKRTLQLRDTQVASSEETAATVAPTIGKLIPVLAGVAAASAYVGYKSVEGAANFQTAMERLVTSAGESQKAIAGVSDKVLQLSDQTGISAKDLANALYYVDSAGYHTAQSIDVLTAAAKGARDEQANVADVTNALTTVMKNYGTAIKSPTQAMNEMIKAVSEGKTNLQDFSTSLAQVLPLASAVHVSFADVAGAIATMTAKGMSAQQAATDLSNAIRNMQAPNNTAINLMNQLGISATDLQTTLGSKGLVAAIDMLRTAVFNNMGPSGQVMLKAFNQSKQAAQDAKIMFDTMPPALKPLAQAFQNGAIGAHAWTLEIRKLPSEQQKLLQQFATLYDNANGFNKILASGGKDVMSYTDAMKTLTGGATGLNTVMMLAGGKDGSMAQFQQNVTGISDVAGQAGNEIDGWSQVQGTFNQKLSEAKQTLANMGIAIGTALLPPLTKLMDKVINFLAPIAQWIDHHRKLAAAILMTVGAIASGLAVFILLGKVITAVGGAVKAFRAVLLLFEADPIVLIITAIVVAVAALVAGVIYAYHHFKAFHDLVDKVGRAFRAIWDEALKYVHRLVQWFDANVLTWLKARLKDLQDWWAEHGKQVMEIVKVLWTVVSTYFKVYWEYIWGTIKVGLDIFRQYWKFNWDLIKNDFKLIWGLIRDYLTMVFHEIMNVAAIFIDIFTGKWGQAWKDAKKLVSQGWDDIKKLFVDFGKNAWNLLLQAGKDIINGLVNGIKSAYNDLKSAVSGIANTVLGVFGGHLKISSPSKVFHGFGVNIVEGLVNGMNASAGAAANAARNLSRQVMSGAQGTLGTVTLAGAGIGGGGGVFAGATGTGRSVVNLTVDLRQAQVAGPNSLNWIMQEINKQFVQKIAPTAGVTIRR